MKKVSRRELLKLMSSNKNICDLDLSDIDLGSMDFSNYRITNVDFSRSNLSKSSFVGSELEKVIFSDSLVFDCNFRRAQFTDVIIAGLRIDFLNFLGASFCDCNLAANIFFYSESKEIDIHIHPIYMHGCNLGYTKFIKNDLTFVEFCGCDLSSSVFDNCKMPKSLSQSNLDSVNFIEPDFTNILKWDIEVDMKGACLRNVDLSQFIFNYVNWSSSDLRGIKAGNFKICNNMHLFNKSIDFSCTNMSGLEIQNQKFIHSNFDNADLSFSNLIRVDFLSDIDAPVYEYSWENVKFKGAVLIRCVFMNISFRNVDFTGATLTDCEFKNCLFDDVIFKESVLQRVSGFQLSSQFLGVDFSDATISFCDFSKMNLQNGICKFHNTSLSNVDFNYSNFSWQKFNYSRIEHCLFSRTILVGSQFMESFLVHNDFEEAIADGIDLSKSEVLNSCFNNSSLRLANLTKAKLVGCDFRRAKLEYCNFEKAELPDSDFTGVSLNYCNLVLSNFSQSKLAMINMSSSFVLGCDFSNSNLDGSVLEGLVLIKSSFVKANLTSASFIGANLKGTSQGFLKNGWMPNLRAFIPSIFNGASMVGVCMDFCDCENSNFEDAILKNCDFTRTRFGGSYLESSDDRSWDADPEPWKGH